MSSLRGRLLASLLTGVVLLGATGGWVVYRNALAEADAFFDYHLRQTALVLRDEPVEYLLAPRLPPTDAAYDFVVQVWSLDGVRVYLSRPHAVLPEITTLGFATVSNREGRWRVFGVQARTRVIQVAQPLSVREQRADPGGKLIEIERLHEIIVGAGVEARHTVGHGIARGDDQYRQ